MVGDLDSAVGRLSLRGWIMDQSLGSVFVRSCFRETAKVTILSVVPIAITMHGNVEGERQKRIPNPLLPPRSSRRFWAQNKAAFPSSGSFRLNNVKVNILRCASSRISLVMSACFVG